MKMVRLSLENKIGIGYYYYITRIFYKRLKLLQWFIDLVINLYPKFF